MHSIGAGCFIAEIQQTSDITYRIYDFGRTGLDGKPRELHTELSKEAIDFSILKDYRTQYADLKNVENEVVSCGYFTTSIYDLTESVIVPVKSRDSFLRIICVSGSGRLQDSEGNDIQIKQGETVLVPACINTVKMLPSGSMKLLSCYVR